MSSACGTNRSGSSAPSRARSPRETASKTSSTAAIRFHSSVSRGSRRWCPTSRTALRIHANAFPESDVVLDVRGRGERVGVIPGGILVHLAIDEDVVVLRGPLPAANGGGGAG